MAETFPLPWFPLFVSDWLTSPARLSMLPEQRGAYLDLLIIAWGSGEREPSLPIDDAQLANLSGLAGRWRKLGALVRAQFVERDGRLFNPKLSEVWAQQQATYAATVARAAKGGKASGESRRRKKKQRTQVEPELNPGSNPSPTREQPDANRKEKVEGTVQPVLQQVVQVPAPDSAPAAELPRASGADPIPPSFSTEWRSRVARVGQPAPVPIS